MYKAMTYKSILGPMTLVSHEDWLVGVWIEGQKYYLGSLPPCDIEVGETAVLYKAAKWLDAYFDGKKPSIDELPLQPMGTAFQQAIWKKLCQIPYGQVTTYGEIARAYAEEHGLSRMSAQAVGGAVGHNPISVIIPCHRVVASTGSLTGYAGGIEKKKKLLQLEGLHVEHDKVKL